VIEQTGGRLSIVEPAGSLASRMRFRRLEWRGDDTTIAADDVVVEWSPLALFSYRLEIRGLGAAAMAIAMKPSDGPASPPDNLALPLSVDIANVAVTQLDVRTGPRANRITGVQFSYAGDGEMHRIRDLRLISEYGALHGDATLAAAAPFALDGRATVVGDGPLERMTFDATLSGVLAEIAVAATGSYRDAPVTARLALTPFADDPLRSATATATDVDLAALREGLPRTQLTATLDARPLPGGRMGGAFRTTNAAAGRIDDDRVPVTEAAGRYELAGEMLALSELEIAVPGGGRVRGDGTIDFGEPDAPSRWNVDVRDLDLARLHSALVATRLSGTLRADIEQERQTIAGNLTQPAISGEPSRPALAVNFAATYAGRRLEVTELRAQAGGGVLRGSGRIALDAPRMFDIELAAQRFDPSRFAALPAGSLSGAVKASGTLLPEWRVTADVALAPDSRYAGVAVSGKAHATVTRHTLANAKVDVTAGSAKLRASGSAGAVGDRVTFALDAPRLAELAPLWPQRLADPPGGSLSARGTAQIEPGGIGGDVAVQAEGLQAGTAASVDRLSAKASFAPGGSAASPVPLDRRPLSVELRATRLAVEAYTLATLSVDAKGSLASHTAKLQAKNESLDIAAAIEGGLSGANDPAAIGAARWSGRLVSFANRGEVPLSLAAPALLELAAGHVRIAGARLAIADGRADIEEMDWTEGRLATRGAVEGIPLASVARLAKRSLPLESTLKLAGDWAVDAVPRLSGKVTVRRESGDLYGVASGGSQTAELAFGIEQLELAATLADDALDATLAFRSRRAGSAQGALKLGAVASAPAGRIAPNAPLSLALDAELASLAPLQPWLGTAAVIDGTAKVSLAAQGTLDAPVLSGTVAGDAIRVDAPQFGV
jgi:translocation and assembly module TamB